MMKTNEADDNENEQEKEHVLISEDNKKHEISDKKEEVKNEEQGQDQEDPSDPSLFDEIAVNLFYATNIYGASDLRHFARQGKLKHGDPVLIQKLLTLPIGRLEALALFKDNIDDLNKVMNTDVYLAAIERTGTELLELSKEKEKQQQQKKQSAEGVVSTNPKPKKTATTADDTGRRRRRSIVESVLMRDVNNKDDDGNVNEDDIYDDGVVLYVIDDGINTNENIDNKETSRHQLVYMMGVDRRRKILKLAFRGTVTVQDWTHDVNSLLKHQHNPLHRHSSNHRQQQQQTDRSKTTTSATTTTETTSTTTIPQAATVGIHDGFHSYLFKKSSGEDGYKSKYETIHEHLDRFRQEYPDYRLCVTGHSLGAALATLFTYQSAIDNRFVVNDDHHNAPPTTTCIVFASPRVGNFKFASAFHELELQGKFRFLRVVNDKDVIPMMPVRPFLPTDLAIYQHVGLELRLFPDGSFKFREPVMCKNRSQLLWHQTRLAIRYFKVPVWCNPFQACCCRDIIKRHSCAEYMNRLENRSDSSRELEEMSLRTLLNKKHEEVMRRSIQKRSINNAS